VLSIAAQSTDPESIFYNTKQIVYDTNPNARRKLLTSPLFQKWKEEKGLTPAILDENITFTTDPDAIKRTGDSGAADLVVLAVPVAQYANAINKLLPFIDRRTIVTDEGSSKMACVERAVETLREHFGDTLPPLFRRISRIINFPRRFNSWSRRPMARRKLKQGTGPLGTNWELKNTSR
jgi:hypothetical protein